MNKSLFLIPLLSALAVQAAVLPVYAQTPLSMDNTMTTSSTDISSQFVPATHNEAWSRSVSVDNEAATLTRYERLDDRNIGLEGEHFSTVVAVNGLLKGFANISLDLVGRPLPSRERSEEVARAFLLEYAPDLLPRMEIDWIDTHDEPIKIERNGRTETVTLTGMKIKARNMADKLWFWVIVGPDEQPMIFERDITWITFPGHRKTEKWLHDSWLKDQQSKAQEHGKLG